MASAAPAAPVPVLSVPVSVPVYFKSVPLTPPTLGTLSKEGPLYAARLDAPILVQTPPIVLSTLSANDALLGPLSTDFNAFAQGIESAILDAVVQRKDEWFHEDVELENSFKRFATDGKLKVRINGDTAVFDTDKSLSCVEELQHRANGAEEYYRVVCILELTRVCFGKTTFGSMWRATQILMLPQSTPCILPNTDSLGEHEGKLKFAVRPTKATKAEKKKGQTEVKPEAKLESEAEAEAEAEALPEPKPETAADPVDEVDKGDKGEAEPGGNQDPEGSDVDGVDADATEFS